jgi:ubiquinone/menaquinone biosynthesis C-methylase UbiE
MLTSEGSQEEHPDSYFVQDHENGEELTRVQIQDQMMTASMGGVLPEQSDPSIFGRVLDVACGTGGWLIETAKTYPSMSLLAGVDVNNKMIEYARMQAKAQGIEDRVQFRVMDALGMLDFPNDSFDLVNQRFAASFLHLQDWATQLKEYWRVVQPGGVIRVTEGDWVAQNNSPALTRLMELLGQAFYLAGHSFTPNSNGVTSDLADILQKSGLTDMRSRANTLEFRAGTASGQRFIEDMQLVFRTSVPFLRKWTSVPDDYEMIYQQALHEMHQSDFVARGSILTAWGNKPG